MENICHFTNVLIPYPWKKKRKTFLLTWALLCLVSELTPLASCKSLTVSQTYTDSAQSPHQHFNVTILNSNSIHFTNSNWNWQGALQSPEHETPRASTKATGARKNSLLTGRNLEKNHAHKGDLSASDWLGKETEKASEEEASEESEASRYIHTCIRMKHNGIHAFVYRLCVSLIEVKNGKSQHLKYWLHNNLWSRKLCQWWHSYIIIIDIT